MNKHIALLLSSTLLFTAGCEKNQKDEAVVSQRYIHKYGYAVAQNEFEAGKYPGQVVTLLKSGITVTSTYEDGVLHGPMTYTFPDSQVIQHYFMYNKGEKVKEIHYDLTGMPLTERVQLSATRYTSTEWYPDGAPMFIEEYAGNELTEGQYFTLTHELEAEVTKGKGTRVKRDKNAALLAKESVEEGLVVKRETFYPTGSPQSVAYYKNNELEGEKIAFAPSGEPLTIETYAAGTLNGPSTQFKNGIASVITHYLKGAKHGLEVHYLDGQKVSQEISWENNRRHGPSKYYLDGIAQTEYYYNGEKIDQPNWKEMAHLEARADSLR